MKLEDIFYKIYQWSTTILKEWIGLLSLIIISLLLSPLFQGLYSKVRLLEIKIDILKNTFSIMAEFNIIMASMIAVFVVFKFENILKREKKTNIKGSQEQWKKLVKYFIYPFIIAFLSLAGFIFSESIFNTKLSNTILFVVFFLTGYSFHLVIEVAQKSFDEELVKKSERVKKKKKKKK